MFCFVFSEIPSAAKSVCSSCGPAICWRGDCCPAGMPVGSRGWISPGPLAVGTWANTAPALTRQLRPPCLCLSLPPSPQPLLPGAERQVQALLSRYGPEKLYQVTSNISGAGTLDLTLLRGQIVALLQNKDTKGNSSRWLVDTGGTWDFVGSSPSSGKTTQQEPAGRSGH